MYLFFIKSNRTIGEITALLLLFALLSSCQIDQAQKENYKQTGVVYQIFVRSFADSNGDGIGDLPGLTSRLSYIEELGANAIWLLPIHQSPSYHKYDVTDYRTIDPVYGTMEDFEKFLAAAHKIGIKVILDMVFNHTDDEHQWFQEALQGPGNPYRDYYVWKDTTSIFENRHQWHEQPADGMKKNESGALFNGFFWKGMPDLNYDHPSLREEIKSISAFWLDSIGVDGFRLDAALHIYPFYSIEQEANLEKTIAWWEEYANSMRIINPTVYLVGEVWEGDSISSQFVGENGLDACFNFSLAERITNLIIAERDTSAFLSAFLQKQATFQSIDPEYSDAIFLSNHDQDRIASRLGGVDSKLKLAASILFTLPGTPFVYYGEEIGMLGQKPDEQIREPFIWDYKGKDPFQTNWEPFVYNDNFDSPLRIQQTDPKSLWMHYQTLIQLRRENPALQAGKLSFSSMDSLEGRLLSYLLETDKESLLLVHNLSADTLEVELLPGYDSPIFPPSMEDLKGEREYLLPFSSQIFKAALN